MFQQSESQPLRSMPRSRFETAKALAKKRCRDRNTENEGAGQKRLKDVLANALARGTVRIVEDLGDDVVRELLGFAHARKYDTVDDDWAFEVESTVRYLGIEVDDTGSTSDL